MPQPNTAEIPVAAKPMAVPIKSYRRSPPPSAFSTSTSDMYVSKKRPRKLVPPQRLRRRFPDGMRVGSALFLDEQGIGIARSGLSERPVNPSRRPLPKKVPAFPVTVELWSDQSKPSSVLCRSPSLPSVLRYTAPSFPALPCICHLQIREVGGEEVASETAHLGGDRLVFPGTIHYSIILQCNGMELGEQQELPNSAKKLVEVNTTLI